MRRHVGRLLVGVLLFAFALLSGCGSKASSSLSDPSKIQAGETSGYTPVVMVIEPGGTGICTGTIVSSKAVLTAAHCTKASGTYTIQGDFGQGTFTATTTSAQSFGPGTVADPNDIALLIFSSPIPDVGSNIYGLGSSVSKGQTLDLVGYGCNNLSTRSGAGVKRQGTNQVFDIDEYLFFVTPISSSGVATSTQRILGPSNRAASCFGDSGGPALAQASGTYSVVGVTHAGGSTSTDDISEYVDLTRSDNRNFLSGLNSSNSLGISGL